MDICKFIESTNLDALITGREVDSLVAEAKAFNFLGICVPPFWVKRAAREIGGSELRLVTVVGFPYGFQMTETKMEEARLAMRDGAVELDMVMNLSAFRDGMPWTKIELAKMAVFAHEQAVILKVIIEAGIWDETEMIRAAKLCADAGVDFVKTSTGRFVTTADQVCTLRKELPSNVGIKASGGITSYMQAAELVKAGADRIGSSKARNLINKN